jgi:cysteine desulfurase/selenocysteine lyase
VVFTRGTTEAINLVANSWGAANLGPGDEIVLTRMEHHSNIVPWQLLAQTRGFTIRVLDFDDRGVLRLEQLDTLINANTRLVGLVHVSNALGTVNPVAEIAERAHAVGALVMVDGAQALPHGAVDVLALGADFYALSGHKAYGPTGIGALWARKHLLDAMPPWQGGGEMIRSVSFEETTYAAPPARFEAGTPNISGAVGLGAALDWLTALDLSAVAAHEAELLAYGTERLAEVPGLRMVGTAPHKAGVMSFVMDGIHPHDVGTILDMEGVAVRTGHHCAQPVMKRLGIPATSRASLGVYNNHDDIDGLIVGLQRVVSLLG